MIDSRVDELKERIDPRLWIAGKKQQEKTGRPWGFDEWSAYLVSHVNPDIRERSAKKERGEKVTTEKPSPWKTPSTDPRLTPQEAKMQRYIEDDARVDRMAALIAEAERLNKQTDRQLAKFEKKRGGQSEQEFQQELRNL